MRSPPGFPRTPRRTTYQSSSKNKTSSLTHLATMRFLLQVSYYTVMTHSSTLTRLKIRYVKFFTISRYKNKYQNYLTRRALRTLAGNHKKSWEIYVVEETNFINKNHRIVVIAGINRAVNYEQWSLLRAGLSKPRNGDISKGTISSRADIITAVIISRSAYITMLIAMSLRAPHGALRHVSLYYPIGLQGFFSLPSLTNLDQTYSI